MQNKEELNIQICQKIMGMAPASVYPNYVASLENIEPVLIKLHMLGWQFLHIRVNTVLAGYGDEVYCVALNRPNPYTCYKACGDILDSILSVLAIMIEGEYE